MAGKKNKMDVMTRGAGSKLADVLKRSGLAASINDANRIARDISTTENKVQSFFDQKKDEMYDELSRRKYNGVVEPKLTQPTQISEVKIPHVEEHIQSDSCPHCKRDYNDNPVLDTNREKEENKHQSIKEMFEEENSGQEFIYSLTGKEQPLFEKNEEKLQSFMPETINETIETKNETIETIPETINFLEEERVLENKMEVIEETSSSKTDFSNEISEAKLEVIEEEPIDSHKYNENSITQIPNEVIPEEKKIETKDEEKIDLTKMFNFSSGKSMSQKMEENSAPKKMEEAKPVVQEVQEVKQSNGISTSTENNHPKTGNSMSIDITEMFNFSKRGV